LKQALHVIAAILLLTCPVFVQGAPAPEDKPHAIDAERLAVYDAAIAPYVAEARRTYPSAKSRFLAGLPTRHVFFATTRLRDNAGRYEQAFVRIRRISNGVLTGVIASDISLVEGYRSSQEYSFPESELIDWLIANPDGSEEGNYVGKFLDTYRP
jgi:hypothetical protein